MNLRVGRALELLQHEGAGRALPDLFRLPDGTRHALLAARGHRQGTKR